MEAYCEILHIFLRFFMWFIIVWVVVFVLRLWLRDENKVNK
jgi:hypothetical protein